MPGPGAEKREASGYWDSIDASHRRNIAVALAVVVVVAVVVAAWLLLRAGSGTPARDIGGGAKVIGGPAAEIPTGSASPTASAQPTGSAAATSSATATGAATFTRAAKVAYRKDGWLWVANEDGTGAKEVVEAAMGGFALSPDGRTLAFEDAAHSLFLARAEGGSAGAARPMAPGGRLAWAPSSEWLVYEGESGQGRRVGRDGTADAVFAASCDGMAVAPDAKRIGYVTRRAGRVGALMFTESDRSFDASGLAGVDDPLAFDWLDAARVAYIVREPSSGDAGLEYGVHVAVLFSGAPLRVATNPLDARAIPSAMCASPDGRHLSWADRGDDGYSRTWLLDVQGGSPVAASKRYDTHPLCWSADGKRLFLIEGNAWQGQKTRLISLSADGTDKRVVVEGAGL